MTVNQSKYQFKILVPEIVGESLNFPDAISYMAQNAFHLPHEHVWTYPAMVAVLQFPEENLFTVFTSLRQNQTILAVLHQIFLKKNRILLFVIEGFPPI